MKGRKRKLDFKFTYKMQKRLGILFAIFCIFFAGLIGRIIYIQVHSGKKYEKIVLEQQEYSSSVIPFQRGNILDSQGTALASSIDVYNVVLDCKALNASPELKDSTEDIVHKCFPEVDIDNMKTRLTKKKNSRYQVLAKKVSFEEKEAFDKLCSERKNDDTKNNECTGIWLEKEYVRQYPYGTLAASVVGITASGNQGISGLEKYYNSELNGVNGRSYGYVSGESSVKGTVVDAENGYSIKTSIDHNIQKIAEEVVKAHNDMHVDDTHKTGSLATNVIVMEPDSGKILAMVDYPGFDLNNPRDLSAYYSEDELNAMSDEDKNKIINSLWNSNCITDTFEPGSTFKPMTIAAGLDSGKLSGNETYVCSGSLKVGDYDIHCWNHNGHGTETIGDALRDSCNVSLMQIGMQIGAKDFSYYQNLFGFGQKTGIDLPGEADTSSLLYSEKDLENNVNIATNAFGQNFNVTRIQMADAFCSIINGGKLYKPYLVTDILDSNGNVVEHNDPIVMKETVSKETSDTIKGYLREVVTDGTGKAAAVEGYDIAGKTGTAEKLPRSLENYVLSFEGFAPVDNPQVMVYVTVDTVNSADQHHDSIAKDIFRDIMTQILPYLNIEKADAATGQTSPQ